MPEPVPPMVIDIEPQDEVVEFFVGCYCPDCRSPMVPTELHPRTGVVLRVYGCTADYCEFLGEIPEELLATVDAQPLAVAAMWADFEKKVEAGE